MNRHKVAKLWSRENGWDVYYSPQTRRTYPAISVPVKREKVYVAYVGDLHCGLKQFARDEFLEFRQWIIDNEAIVYLMGDLMETATKRSPGDSIFEMELGNEQQIDCVCDDLLEPIKEQIVGAVRGNHEFRVNRETGIDPMNTVCYRLKVPYMGWESFGTIYKEGRKGSACAYSTYSCHSYAANKDAGLALHWGEMELEKWLLMDIIARGHSHDLGFQPTTSYVYSKHNLGLTEWVRYLVMTGHWLRRMGGYNQQKPKRAKTRGTVALEVSMVPNQKQILPHYHVAAGGKV